MSQSPSNFPQHGPGSSPPPTSGAIEPAGFGAPLSGADGFMPSASGRYPSEENSGLDLQSILAIARRRWKWMLGVFVLCVAGSAYTLARSRPIYDATATLELSQTDNDPDVSNLPGLSQFNSGSAARSMETQIAILKSSTIARGARARLSAERRRAMGSMANVDVAQIDRSSLLAVKVTSFDPRGAAEFANAVCGEYVAASLEKNRDNSHGAVDYVQRQIVNSRARLARAQDNLRRFKQETGIFSISDESASLSSRLGGLRATLQQAQNDRISTQAQFTLLQSQLSAIPAKKLVPVGVERNPIATDLQTQLRALEIERSTALQEYTPTSFRVRGLDDQIRSLKERLKTEPATRVSAYQPDPRLQPLRQNADSVELQLSALDARIADLKTQEERAQKAFARLPDQEFRFAQLTTEATAQLTTYQLLTERLQSLLLGEEAKVADGRLLFAATPRFGPVAPDSKRIWLSGIILGLIGAVALAMLIDALDNRIYSDEDAQRATSLPVLAQIPFMKRREEQSLLLTGDRITPLLESNRMLRANISFCATDRPIKSVVVTSSVPGEGKSSTALNLAIAAAANGENTILIDLDLRRPVQHTMSGLPNAHGFTTIVSGQAEIADALQDTPIPGLRILTSGPTPPNPYKMLSSQSARSTMQKLIEMADFVVVDTPPMLGLADARLIASLVDGTLMVISCQETGRREAARAADLLLASTHDVLGTILTKVPQNAGTYGGYYTYQRYGRYFDDSQKTTESMEEAAPKGEITAGKAKK